MAPVKDWYVIYLVWKRNASEDVDLDRHGGVQIDLTNHICASNTGRADYTCDLPMFDVVCTRLSELLEIGGCVVRF